MDHRQRLEMRRRIHRIVLLVVSIILSATASIIETIYSRHQYHTSALSGYAWVLELLTGHPERIRCELGMHKHVFLAIIDELRELGYGDSRSVTLEEQLAIFLYISVTGLSIRHAGERFQHANETMSR
jgi:hypothetical protein